MSRAPDTIAGGPDSPRTPDSPDSRLTPSTPDAPGRPDPAGSERDPGRGAGPSAAADPDRARRLATRLLAPAALLVIVVVLASSTPAFATGANLVSVLSAGALLAIVACAMTVVVRGGGIDLSVGVAVDLAALGATALIADGYVTWFAVAVGLAFGTLAGVVNAVLVTLLRIRAFLATLSVWFVGTSVQQLLTDGGAPIYLRRPATPDSFAAIGNATVLGVPLPVVAAVAVAVAVWFLLDRTRWGRVVTAAGEQRTATRIAGRATVPALGAVFVVAALVASIAGILLASRSYGFVGGSGQAYVLDAIGAVFVGATLSRHGRPNVLGTLVGVLVFTILSNGLALLGVSYYWDGLVRGAVLLALLVTASVLARGTMGPSLRSLVGRASR
ncbi:ABC transporter permease [Frigoribacterium faeni]|uniref:Ribose transport system permease protein n=1 Tax=Frigoribacterium faeni TaxID=145483 RepID=A0A7W3PHV6_9MICO|nr:ABC transporter permease [Frigoribacterium faeni]MBA8812398.1 ribose transport system permease protein [Frigoribacterium faeni]BFF13464.1 hypothetical protein GCM10025699_47670 [Microbacterium flavescens]GEK81888.1 hypothetical protein FFA01_01970 [Frigoribacterium faeni]